MPAGEISTLFASLRAAKDIANAFITLRDETMIQSKVIELQAVIMAAQQSAMTAQLEQHELVERVRELEKEKAALEAWNAEKQRYALTEFPIGVFLYVLKPEAANDEPIHRLCPGCFVNGKKSILQTTSKTQGVEQVFCLECRSYISHLIS